ncbi:MAG TPA: hypothetical protein VG820_10445, partial [Fimbriimonadaceae bacterium]|nr:hypothetical protein [Fimbriimonadaceae bacterium]
MLTMALAAILLRPQAIDYECKARRLSAVLKELSKPMGEELTATPSLGERFVVVSVHGVKPEELRAQLAKTLCAKWATYSGGAKLSPDSDAEKQEEAKLLASRLDRLRKAHEALSAAVAKMGHFGHVEAEALLGRMTQVDQAYEAEDRGGMATGQDEAACENAPGQRAATRMVLLLDPAQIAMLRGRVAFSDRPTSLQLPLPAQAKGIIAQLAAEQKAWCAVYSGDPKFDARHSWLSVDPRANRKPIDASTTRCFLKFQAADGEPNIEVFFVDPEDSILTCGFVRFDVPRAAPSKPTAEDETATVAMPDEDKAYVQILREHKFTPALVPSPEWRNVFLHPEKFEPLSYACSDALIGAAKARQENLVAWVGDDAFQVGGYAWTQNDKPMPASRFWRYVGYGGLQTEA